MSERTALVTGGARGIGRAIALALAEEGQAVAVGDVRMKEAEETAAAVKAAGGRAVALPLDVTDSAAVAAGVRLTAELLGRVDVLVNNAGWDELRPFLDTDEPFWERGVDVGAVILCVQVAVDPDAARALVGVGIVVVRDVRVEQTGAAAIERERVLGHLAELAPKTTRIRLDQVREGVDQNLDDLLCAVHASFVPGSTAPAPETGCAAARPHRRPWFACNPKRPG
jgi:hypothetical protein